jgi:HEAT repeat protein
MKNPNSDILKKVFDADRLLRRAQGEFFTTGEDDARIDALEVAINESWEGGADPEESHARLMRVGALLGDVGGPRACKLLLRLLDHEEPEVRLPAGESLEDLAYSRYAEVARAIEKLIDDGKAATALSEVPYILAEIGEPGGVKLCQRLLKHPAAEVVASAIESLAALGDPVVVKDLEKLRNDRRRVAADDDPEAGEIMLGDLATEAIEHLRSLEG